jgi:hypothetical protein
MFLTALLTLAQVSINRRMDKEVHTHTHTQLEYYSIIQKNGIISFAGQWMDVEIISLRKISQTLYPIFSLICGI